MIITELYNGQGLGNQLWAYVVTRIIAESRGHEFGIKSPEKFKGSDFLNLDFGQSVIGGEGDEGRPPRVLPDGITHYYEEKKIIHPNNGSDIRTHDYQLVNIEDNTKIDGCMQDEQYILHRRDEIRKWLAVKESFETSEFSSDDICIINFRGSGYVSDKDFFLTKTYWENAIKNMRKLNPNFKFVVITEDVKNAKKFFPDFEVYHFSIAKDYVVIKNARYLILSNSSFAWFPAWLSVDLKFCIAPKYWARHNISDGYWSLGYNMTTGWMYQDRTGRLQDYQSCLQELEEYKNRHPELYSNKTSFKPTLRNKIISNIQIFKAFRKETSSLGAFKSLGALNISKILVYSKKKIRWILKIL